MYCIIALPRTASTNLAHMVNSSLTYVNPVYRLARGFERFNPRYNTPETIEQKYQQVVTQTPLPVIKLISSHDFGMAQRFLDNGLFKTVFLKPDNLQKQVLKTIVAKQTDSFVDSKLREPYVGTLTVTLHEIQQRLHDYVRHMEFESQCDYVFTTEQVVHSPQEILTTLGLPFTRSTHKYTPPKYTDEEMLLDVNDFYEKYSIAMRLL